MSRYTDRKNAVKIFKEIEAKPEDYSIIHYSSESFYDTNGHTPKVTAIAIRNYADGQVKNFSIHQYAEFENIHFDEISNNYEHLEAVLLHDYFEYVKEFKHKTFIHWNMRDSNYGFSALEHRYKILKGTPTVIDDSKKIDLSNLLYNAYGEGYIGDPKMLKLMELNNNNPKNFLIGGDEAQAFKDKNYVSLSMSTSSKVKLFSDFLSLAINNQLKTNNSKWKIYGSNIQGYYEYIKDTPGLNLFLWAVNLIIGAFVGAWISGLFS